MIRQTIAVLLLAACSCSASAQDPSNAKELVPHPLDRKLLAKAKREAVEAEPRPLAVASRDAVRVEFDGWMKAFLVGRGSDYSLHSARKRLLAAELAVAADESQQLTAFQFDWIARAMIHQVGLARYEAGRIPAAEFLEGKYYRLEGDRLLQKHTTAFSAKHPNQALPAPELPDYSAQGRPDVCRPKAYAKEKKLALAGEVNELVRRRLTGVEDECVYRYFRVLDGWGSIYFMQLAAQRYVETAVLAEPDSSISFLQSHCRMNATIERIAKRRYGANRVPPWYLNAASYWAVDSEIRLAETRAKSPPGHSRRVIFWPNDEQPPSRWFSEREVEFAHATLNDLRLMRRDLANAILVELAITFLEGRGRADSVALASIDLLEAELALLEGDADRLAAIERHWARMQVIEMINRGRFDKGRIWIVDYEVCRYYLLQASLQLNDAWRKAQPKP